MSLVVMVSGLIAPLTITSLSFSASLRLDFSVSFRAVAAFLAWSMDWSRKSMHTQRPRLNGSFDSIFTTLNRSFFAFSSLVVRAVPQLPSIPFWVNSFLPAKSFSLQSAANLCTFSTNSAFGFDTTAIPYWALVGMIGALPTDVTL